MGSVVLIDSDALRAERLAATLLSAGHDVTITSSTLDGLVVARASRPALVITDFVLPDGSAMEVIGRLSRAGIPVVVMGRADVEAEVTVSGMGAQAYLARPFDVQELLACVAAAVLKHRPEPRANVLVVGELMLDVRHQLVRVGEKQLRLSLRERDLLSMLMRDPGRVFSAEELAEGVWGAEVRVARRRVEECVWTLRRKLQSEGAAGYLRTVRGAGFAVQALD
jgi:DNA-binding response OmpR family regulator